LWFVDKRERERLQIYRYIEESERKDLPEQKRKKTLSLARERQFLVPSLFFLF
jgi:hypothetical protein